MHKSYYLIDRKVATMGSHGIVLYSFGTCKNVVTISDCTYAGTVPGQLSTVIKEKKQCGTHTRLQAHRKRPHPSGNSSRICQVSKSDPKSEYVHFENVNTHTNPRPVARKLHGIVVKKHWGVHYLLHIIHVTSNQSHLMNPVTRLHFKAHSYCTLKCVSRSAETREEGLEIQPWTYRSAEACGAPAGRV